jgi:hypothetical protein
MTAATFGAILRGPASQLPGMPLPRALPRSEIDARSSRIDFGATGH